MTVESEFETRLASRDNCIAGTRAVAAEAVAAAAPVSALLGELPAGTAGARLARPPAMTGPDEVNEPLTQREKRVLRPLPTHLSASGIASELYVSSNIVKTHIRHIYDKLGVHRRAEAVERARCLGLVRTVACIGRPGSPEEIASAILYLASDESLSRSAVLAVEGGRAAT